MYPLSNRRLVAWNGPSARTIFLQFLPGRSNRFLVSVRMTARPRAYLLQCWDVAQDSPRCVAELRHADGPYGGVVLNSDPTSTAVLAMQSAQTETFSIDFDAHDPESAFVTEAAIDGIRELHLLAGSTLVTRHTDNGGALSLWDLADLSHEKIQLLNPSLVQPDDRVQAVHIAHNYALVIRVRTIEIYSTTPRPSLLAARGTPIAYPLAHSRLQWRTHAVLVCPQHAPAQFFPPIHLLVRFGTTAHVLHHYVLHPNPPRRHTTEYSLPYDLGLHAIGAPVRLSGQSAMALGPYGTALWLDNQAGCGQRLAGRVVRDGVPTQNGASTPIVLTMRDDDAWTRIAMEEEVGRIALGHVDGAITLLEY